MQHAACHLPVVLGALEPALVHCCVSYHKLFMLLSDKVHLTQIGEQQTPAFLTAMPAASSVLVSAAV